jgi:hypothetical protein
MIEEIQKPAYELLPMVQKIAQEIDSKFYVKVGKPSVNNVNLYYIVDYANIRLPLDFNFFDPPFKNTQEIEKTIRDEFAKFLNGANWRRDA